LYLRDEISNNMAQQTDDKKIIFSMVGVSKAYQANKQILKDIYLSFYYGAKIGIIGLNGSGKSTLLKIIAGLEKSYQGNVVFSPGYSVGYLPQEPQLDPNKTVKEVVMEGVQQIYDTLVEYDEVNHKFELPEYYEDQDKMDALMARQAELQDMIDSSDAWNIDNKLEQAMDALRLPPEDQKIGVLSGGERRRVALCRLLLQQPDILLLDEPTNHLDAESIDWLEQHLQQYSGTVIAVTHDRYFLDNVAGWILELDRGEGIPWKGNYSGWLEQKTQRMAQEEKQASKRRKTLERELEWAKMAPKARQAKGKARLNSYDKLMNEDVKSKEEKLEIFIPNGPRLGNKVIEAKGVAKAYGEKLLFDNLNFSLPPNGIVGVIGPNGAGKTTLFRLIMGLDKVDKGTFEIGETVKIAYVDQQHKDIDPSKSVYQVVSGGSELIRLGGRDINARAYLGRFNFTGADQEKLCGMLSGGERNRLQLAMALKEEGNVLLLDEPTNDIDVNTLRALEEGLDDFAGCAVVVSHDRWFLDRICTHILSFEGNSEVVFYEGSYSDYEEYKTKQLGYEEPKRIRYRKLIND
jgi:energy-dependent translational throttle protein EttA